MSIHFHFVLDFYDVASNGHEKEVFTSQKTLLNSLMNQWNKCFDVHINIYRAVFKSTRTQHCKTMYLATER